MSLETHYSPVNISEYKGVRYLHLGTEWIQGSMHLRKPFEIELEYARRMMVWLLFFEPQTVSQRHAMQLGLGAGALTKFCYQKLQMSCTAIELNPKVLEVCRQWFELPDEDARLKIILADAGNEICKPEHQGQVHALAVDLYDEHAAAPVLDTHDFYVHCRDLLAPDGCMTVNLFGWRSSFKRSLQRIVDAFGSHAVWVCKATHEGNTVVLAQRTPTRLGRSLAQARAREIERLWGLPARRWLGMLKAFDK